MSTVTLRPLSIEDRNQFILDNQAAFNYGSMLEFGLRNDKMEEDGETIHIIHPSAAHQNRIQRKGSTWTRFSIILRFQSFIHRI